MDELADRGLVTSGSVMVPTPHFDEIAELARRRPELDIGIHLTLNCESDYLKWGPITSPAPGSGLVDDNGHFHRRVQTLRDRADPIEVEAELRAQIEKALEAGIKATHLDHHMGAALNPEFAELTLGLGREFGIPVMFPRHIAGYFELLDKGPVDIDFMESVRDRLEEAGELKIDQFAMGLQIEGDTEDIYRTLISEAEPGVTYVALHCSAPGEIDQVHPRDFNRRIAEYDLFANPTFIQWAKTQVELINAYPGL